ncbi:MAG TPA: HEAT repeat domain-containing protein [Deltaproteobacteria bacterium]|nr:HEAT repeat domain-containing protein [Deltaproteobacteria bacterium]
MLIIHDRGVNDVARWFRASFGGTLWCIALYTLYGYFLVRHHAGLISSGMELLISFGMTPLITPGDDDLTSMTHLLGSALFFGCTLGVLNALVNMAASVRVFTIGMLGKRDAILYLVLGGVCSYFSYSREFPVLSLIFGFFCPLAFFLPWIAIMRKARQRKRSHMRWLVFLGIMCSPFLFLAAAGSSSYETIRDSLLLTRAGQSLSAFYYTHTPLAAHVIAPVASRDQKVIAVSSSIGKIGPLPHGTLWIRAKDPCSVSGSSLVLSREPLACQSIVIEDSHAANQNNRIFREYGTAFDHNRTIRSAIGLFLFKGPVFLIPLLFLAWLSLWIADVFERSRVLSFLMITVYILAFLPAAHTQVLRGRLVLDPERIHEYILSEHETKRYLAITTYPESFSVQEISRYAQDSSARIRINALLAAAQHKNQGYFALFTRALKDPQLNVRTKACWGLGLMGTQQALSVLEDVLVHDSSWYVRGYAHGAIGRIRPVSRVVEMP